MFGQQGVEVVGEQPRLLDCGVGGVACSCDLCRSEIIIAPVVGVRGGCNAKGRGGLTADDGDGGEEIS